MKITESTILEMIDNDEEWSGTEKNDWLTAIKKISDSQNSASLKLVLIHVEQ